MISGLTGVVGSTVFVLFSVISARPSAPSVVTSACLFALSVATSAHSLVPVLAPLRTPSLASWDARNWTRIGQYPERKAPDREG